LKHRRNFKSTLEQSTHLKVSCEKGGGTKVADFVTEENSRDWLPLSGWEVIEESHFREKAEGRPPLRTVEGEPVKMTVFVAEKRKKKEEDEAMLHRLQIVIPLLSNYIVTPSRRRLQIIHLHSNYIVTQIRGCCIGSCILATPTRGGRLPSNSKADSKNKTPWR